MAGPNASTEEAMWAGMASAIAGSGSYALDGTDRKQVENLVTWLRQGRDKGYNWQRTYAGIYAYWGRMRPLFPTPDEMASLVEQRR